MRISPFFNPNQHLPALTRAARGLPDLPGVGRVGTLGPLPRGFLLRRKAAALTPGIPHEKPDHLDG